MAQRILLVTVMALLCGCFAKHGDAEAKLRNWNQLLSKDLHRGSTRAAVMAFFLRNGVEPSFSSAGRTVTAIDRDVETDGLVSTSITFECQLDLRERLENCKAELVGTGP
jgi:hypothetical protein